MVKPVQASILHVDMNAFYASIEVRERPELRGKPVVVGGGQRGVVAAASYEARVYGIHSAMPAAVAQRRCPDAIFLPGNYELYSKVSRSIMETFADVSPLIEPLSADEAFLDVGSAVRLFGSPTKVAHRIRRLIWETEKLRCSVGVAASKSVAKIASEEAKPRVVGPRVESGPGVLVVPAGTEASFLAPLSLRSLWGVGPKTFRRLNQLGLVTVGDVANLPVDVLCGAVGGAQGKHLAAMARGVDSRPVEPNRGPKSISHEETFRVDLVSPEAVQAVVVRQADAVASRLRRTGRKAKTVVVKTRYGDFTTVSRARTLAVPTTTAIEIASVANDLINQHVDINRGIRLVGVGVKGFVDQAVKQLSLDDVSADRGTEKAEAAVDEIRHRFGSSAIGFAGAGAGPDGDRRHRPWAPKNLEKSDEP